ncbi:MAG: gliding motility-associated C-terminal domain-containing protein [Flavobacteriales bacterium]|nr:gliding motility-associated C-terminal domain-containing protein [Flavobacteriales bacterium]
MYRPKKNLFALAALAGAVFFAQGMRAQVPVKCLEIESILVDACISLTDCPGSSEGMNEMVRFITGPAPIALGDLQFQFFSSTFRGITQDAGTALLTSQLNASIQSCGHLMEPPGGVIPPGSRVIFVTSTAMCVQANPFTALSDTLYIIFQTPGNSQGHFKNNDLVGQPISPVPNAPLIRWLRLYVNGTACGDTATYDANQLVNIYGTYGGLTEENDGATAVFAWPGPPDVTYVNYGCQAPFTPTLVTILSAPDPIPCGQSANLIGAVSGPYAHVHWHGGGGVFSQADSLSTDYTPGGGDSGEVELSFCAITACGDTLCAQVTVTTGDMPSVTITGDTTLCDSTDNVVLTASGADSYLWSTGDTTDAITVDGMAGTAFWVVGANSCGTDSAFVALSLMSAVLTSVDVQCNGAADGSLGYVASGGEEPYSYVWSTGSTDPMIDSLAPGPYSVSVTDDSGCTLNASYTITEPDPVTTTVGADTTICPGGEVTLSAEAAGGTPDYTYTWTPEGPVVSPLATTTYTVVASDANGCQGAPQQVTVSVPTDQAVSISHTPLDGCAPHCITFTASSSAQHGYTWDFGDEATATDSVAEHCYTDAGQYSVNLVVQPASGCPEVQYAVGPFTISVSPVADFSWIPITPTLSDPEVHFTDLSGGATSWAWHFGDPADSSSTDISPTFTFPSAGCFPVSLVVTNDAGCADSTVQQVCVLAQDSLIVPNIFSPNSDGRNDVFRIRGGDLTSLEVHIFNRWGQQVALLERVNQVWDGRSPAGEVLSEGTYFYTLRGVGRNGTAHDQSGTITLVR